ncbi:MULTISPECIES: gentisate 1,2-dioxygenase [Chelativorans]|jgi:gentisate 1,2-dioxygenase|uniref:Gentisate 1,2-dioxygenase n=1 Tax=Chelativorans sp. (strain BNC1) TaxID=266779 RepID=Q11MB7_CHESB|nr:MULTISPECIES: gentisate 1,2-dioxygenase [Chelativorans]
MSDALSKTPQSYIDAVEAQALAPLWGRLRGLVPTEPKPQAEAHLWDFDALKPHILEAGRLVTAKEAERRVLILENPALKGTSRIADSVFAGFQIILPGEVAPSHRHSQAALRFVLDGSGAYTAVGGERTTMEFGDFIVTPPWRWHDHGNPSDAPMIWLDGLDIPMVRMFNAGFEEDMETEAQEIVKEEGDSLARYGSGLMPVDQKWERLSSPVFNYSYEKSRAAVEQAARTGKPDPCHGWRLRYTNPVDGGWAMPTLATYLRKLPAGFVSTPYRSTESTVFVVTEGRGHVEVAGKRMAFKKKDIFVVPAWTSFTLEAEPDTFLFNYSDRAAQEKLGFFMEARGNEAPSFPPSH